MNSPKATYIYILVLLPLIYFAIFLHLDSLPFRVWDEAYLATHAYEMMHDHDYIVTHSFGAPEMSNTKPPLVIWFMVASCKLLGFSELAIRLPNALAGVAICLIIFSFCTFILHSSFKGFLSSIVLISSAGFIRLHVTRSGEYDAFLTLFVTIFCLAYFLILEFNKTDKNYSIYWIVFTLAMTCAVLTKGVAAFLVIPALLIFTIVQKKLILILRSKEIYLSIFFIAFFGIGYYFLREHYNPGYIRAVSENELGGRYLNPMWQNSRWVYFDLIVNSQFKYWFPFALIAIFNSISSPDGLDKRIITFCTSVSFGLILVLSLGSTRLNWYDAPAFPFLAVIAGSGVYVTLTYLFRLSLEALSRFKVVGVTLFLVLLMWPAYSNIIVANLFFEEDPWDANSYNLTHYIELSEKKGINLNGYKVVNDWFMLRALSCQVKKWDNRGQKMEIINNLQSLRTNDKVIISQDPSKSEINELYEHEGLDHYKNVEVWRILGPKTQ